MARRAERMVQLTEAVTACFAQRQQEPQAQADVQRAEALVAQLQAERAGLTQQLELARDLSTRSQSACSELQQQASDCRAELDKTLKDLHRERVKKPPAAAAAPEEAAAAVAAAVAPSAAAAGAASGDMEVVNQQLRKAQEEVAALGKTASERLDETVTLKQELAKLRADLQEALARPATDDQLRSHPQYSYLLNQQRALTSQLQTEKAATERLRSELEKLNESWQDANTRAEQNRAALHEEARETARRDAEALARAKADKHTIELQLGQMTLQHTQIASRADEMARVVGWCQVRGVRRGAALQRLALPLWRVEPRLRAPAHLSDVSSVSSVSSVHTFHTFHAALLSAAAACSEPPPMAHGALPTAHCSLPARARSRASWSAPRAC